ncbi:MAG: ABC transporter substrate-binding protein, partial [Gammaproteobacteria bacterium]|nr:ABC transporter substrate-binding protein [Gammaproteobacteria bacterium]
AKIGINLDIRSYDWGTFYGDIKNGRFQMYSLAWIGIKSPTIFHYALHSDMVPPNGANRGRYRNLTVDHTIDQAMMEIDLVKQAALYRQVQQILLDDLPYIPLWYENHTVVTRKFIKNYKVNSDGNYDGLVSAEKVS